ncbi:uncharacterized protein B0H18DRAFT_662804 [Fomitopsis serialis]|uniref:uncharacterized protein n=1 Tax=Fomitopsis serialis TaxID=139415 RepID=UPI0020072893|nr:uncharacterized protein B0H18DRAFT_662804 [Neoantrodia serialis]KAH9918658.1 hypothetical protein B0H18DRAFT_662804 [Neoantrodia serialis]
MSNAARRRRLQDCRGNRRVDICRRPEARKLTQTRHTPNDLSLAACSQLDQAQSRGISSRRGYLLYTVCPVHG